MLRLEENVLPESLQPDTCQQLFDLCQRRCRTEAHIGDSSGGVMRLRVSNGRVRLTSASETTKKLWEPTLRALARAVGRRRNVFRINCDAAWKLPRLAMKARSDC